MLHFLVQKILTFYIYGVLNCRAKGLIVSDNLHSRLTKRFQGLRWCKRQCRKQRRLYERIDTCHRLWMSFKRWQLSGQMNRSCPLAVTASCNIYCSRRCEARRWHLEARRVFNRIHSGLQNETKFQDQHHPQFLQAHTSLNWNVFHQRHSWSTDRQHTNLNSCTAD
jgi:hypothetical protein